jgi:hypothetical protein
MVAEPFDPTIDWQRELLLKMRKMIDRMEVLINDSLENWTPSCKILSQINNLLEINVERESQELVEVSKERK